MLHLHKHMFLSFKLLAKSVWKCYSCDIRIPNLLSILGFYLGFCCSMSCHNLRVFPCHLSPLSLPAVSAPVEALSLPDLSLFFSSCRLCCCEAFPLFLLSQLLLKSFVSLSSCRLCCCEAFPLFLLSQLLLKSFVSLSSCRLCCC